MEPDDPFEEEQDVLGASNDGGYEEPRNAGAAEVGPSSHQPGQASEDGDAEPPNDDAAEAARDIDGGSKPCMHDGGG